LNLKPLSKGRGTFTKREEGGKRKLAERQAGTSKRGRKTLRGAPHRGKEELGGRGGKGTNVLADPVLIRESQRATKSLFMSDA